MISLIYYIDTLTSEFVVNIKQEKILCVIRKKKTLMGVNIIQSKIKIKFAKQLAFLDAFSPKKCCVVE